jgi:peptidase E
VIQQEVRISVQRGWAGRWQPSGCVVPSILATSGGFQDSDLMPWKVGPLTRYAVDLAGVADRAPRVCLLATACGDDKRVITAFYDNAWREGWVGSHLAVFPKPNVADPRGHLLAQDVLWVWGGSVAGLLALWCLHGLDSVLREAWQAGVVLTGVSAGSICWHVGGPTDSFGAELRPVTDGLGLVPWSNGVHYNGTVDRRSQYLSMIAGGTLPPGYATDNGAGVLYRGTDFVEALAENEEAGVYWVEPDSQGSAVETPLNVRKVD